MPLQPFASRLAEAVRRKRTPAMVGLDPRAEQLPAGLLKSADASLAERADAYLAFCRGVIDVVAPLVPVVKPQAAFFEELGPAGMTALAGVIGYARERGLLVVLDGKRNDIGSTAAAYAQAYLAGGERAAWQSDALTVSPYLGDDSLTPFVEVARQSGGGIFVLVKTSNPGGGQFQDLIADGRPIYRHVAEHVERLAAGDALLKKGDWLGASGDNPAETVGRDVPVPLFQQEGEAEGYGLVGAVVGATYPEQLSELRQAMPHAWLLVPGFGSQGGTAKDVAAAFDSRGLGGLINNSRGIIFAHGRKEYAHFGAARWQDAVAAATHDMIEQLRGDTPAGKL